MIFSLSDGYTLVVSAPHRVAGSDGCENASAPLPSWHPSCAAPARLPFSCLKARLSVLHKPALMVSCFPGLQEPFQLQIGDVTINLQSDLIPGLRHIAKTTSRKSASCEPTSTPQIRCCCDLSK